MKIGKLNYIQNNFHVIYSIALIVFIPIAIVANTLIIRATYEKSIEQEGYRNITSIGELINANVWDVVDNPPKLQERIKNIAKYNKDITSLDVMIRNNDKFQVAASLDESVIGETSDDMQNFFAWHEEKPVAFLTNSATPNSVNQNLGDKLTKTRYRVLTKPLLGEDGKKIALLSLKVSIAETDALSSMAMWRSMLVLFITIIIIVLLLINNTRLFEYAVLYRKLKEVDQMKDEFISMASHELRTPVTGIRGYVSMILDGTYGPIDDMIRKSLSLVAQEATRLANLVEDLLNVSRIDQGRIQIKLAMIDIVPVVQTMIDELQIQATQKSLTLNYTKPTSPLPLLNIDADRLKQIIVNLVGNSIKYTLKGGVEITTKHRESLKTVEIKIKDSGIGMSAKARERLFEKFYRVQDENTKNIVGTGLGLWITKQLIELQGGTVAVDSIEGVGTQVTVSFPVKV